MAKKAGWGRIHVKRIPADKAGYMGKYLTKENRALCFKGWRLWAAFGEWRYTKVKDIHYQSEYSSILRGLIAMKKERRGFLFRLEMADRLYAEGIAGTEVGQRASKLEVR